MDSRKQKRVKKLPIAQWRKDTTTLLTEIDQSFAKNAYKTNFTLRQRNKDRLQEYRNSHKVTANTQSDNTAKLIKMKNFIRKLEELAKAPPAEVSHTVDPKVTIMPIIADVDLTQQEKVNDTATTIQQPQENINDPSDILNAVANANEQQEVDKSKFAVHIEHDSRSDGDCFYSSIYLAAKKQDLLKTIGPCLQVNIEDETAFIQDMRNKAGDKVREDRNSGGTIYNNVKDLFASMSNNNATNLIRQSFPPWFKDKFGVHGEKIGDKDTFYDILEISVRTPKAWVFDTDSRFITELLNNSCGIVLQTYKESENQPIPQNLPKYLDNKPIIHLFLNADEKHYEYFSFNDSNTAILDVGKSYQDVAKVAEIVDKKEVIEASEAPLALKQLLNSDCIQLHDPCTREPVANMGLLERRIREIKKSADTIPVGLYGLTNDTSNYDFIMNVFVNPAISLDEMVSFRLAEGGQPGSDIYEVLSRLYVFLGGIQHVNPRDGGNYKFMKKIEGNAPEIYESSTAALKNMKCKATRAMGISDITLVNHRNDKKSVKPTDPYCEIECNVSDTTSVKTYLMSVKWYKDEKNAEHYDIEKLYTATQKITTTEQRPVGIIVFLKSKSDFQIAHNRSYRQYVHELGDAFLGWNEDVKPFLEEKRRALFELATLKGISPRDAFENQYFIPGSKPALSLYLHQDIIVKGLCDALGKSNDNLFLVGVLPRGGKTLIAGGIMREYLNRTKIPNMNILWLTAAPNETISQVKNELLEQFQDFDNFEFIEAKKEASVYRKTKPHTVIFCSSQLLIKTQKEGAKLRQFLQNLLTAKDQLGLVFFDEAHKTGAGDETKAQITTIIETYSQFRLPFIFLTATYYNILFDYQVQTENTFIWDYTDVLATRALATESEQEAAITNLQKRFGKNLVDDIINKRIENGDTLITMAKAYIGFPDLYFLSADFNTEALKRFEEQDKYRPDSGFSLNTIFAIKPETTIRDIITADNKVRKDAYKSFENLDNPRNIVALITHTGSFEESGEGGKPLTKEEGSSIEPSILGRINKASRDSKSRFRLDERPTLLMFMPVGGIGTNICYLLCAWASLLLTHSYWRDNYEIACVVAGETLSAEDLAYLVRMESTSSTGIRIINSDLKSSLLKYERELHCEKRKGLVILAGEKLSMGISLPCTDVVFLFNEKKSPDDIIQKMYRALTPSIGKKSAYVVDLNPVRTLAAIYGYTRHARVGSNTKSEILDIIYDTYTWDGDVFDYSLAKGPNTKPLSFQDKLRQLFEKAEQDDTYKLNEDIGGFEKKLADNVRRGIDPDFISKLRGKFSAERLKESLGRIGLTEGSTFGIDNKGKLVIRTKVPKPLVAGEEPTVDEIEIVIDNFIETLADFVKYLSITSKKPTLQEAITEYESNSTNSEGTSLQHNVLKLVKSRTPITGIQDDALLSKILITAVKDFASQSSSMVYDQMKSKVDEKSVRKNAVLKIIHRHLTPRKKQKEEKGEVFTPVELIENMLSHLPTSIWKNHELKWLDPANGIGNFPIVAFYRLDEGLKSWESNETKRRKHIIENMLYMLEIQSNNSRIARNLFEKLCDGCKPNILTTNSLEMTSDKLKAKGFPEKYDVIIGNPPFNAGGLLARQPYWIKFIKLAFDLIKEGGYITYVHPPGWRKFFDPEDRENKGKILYDIRQKGWNIDYLNISDSPPKHFPVVDYYVIHAKNAEKPTEYNTNFMGIVSTGSSQLDYPFIPNMLNKETFGILDKLFKAEGFEININRTGGKYGYEPSKKDIGKTGIKHYHYTDKSGEKVFYGRNYDVEPDYIHKPKVILTFSNGYEKGRLFAFYSEDKIGVTRTALYIIVKSKQEGEKIANFLNSDIITFLMKITQYDAVPFTKNEYKILNLLKVPDSMDEYHLTEKEHALIKRVVSKKEDVPEEAVAVAEGGSRYSNKTRKNRRH